LEESIFTEDGMKHTGRHFMLGLAVMAMAFVAASGVARAQTAAVDASAPPPEGARPGPHGPGDEMFRFLGFEMGMHGKTVTGAPFNATFSAQTTQTLADGNLIQRSTTGTVARDSQGRTHRDLTLPAIGPWATSGEAPPHAVFIDDPVAGTHFILQPDKKTAEKMTPPGGNWRDGQGRSEARSDRRNSNGVVTADLGTQTINGIAAQGTRTTHTIPAGQIGNQKPIVVVSERWYSAELQMNVMTKRTDPRTGETTVTQLTNIQRAEPDATLFQVPADYTVTQGRTHGAHRGPQAPPAPPAAE
jgi:hypothetical protein